MYSQTPSQTLCYRFIMLNIYTRCTLCVFLYILLEIDSIVSPAPAVLQPISIISSIEFH